MEVANTVWALENKWPQLETRLSLSDDPPSLPVPENRRPCFNTLGDSMQGKGGGVLSSTFLLNPSLSPMTSGWCMWFAFSHLHQSSSVDMPI